VLASRAGTLMQLGIGPIVTAGIVMQLLVGAKIINLDLSHPRDKALFTGTQKILAVLVGIFQASAFVMAGSFGPIATMGGLRILFLIIQLTLGVLVVLYLDELVSKYGFGSGISLFIAGGVSATVFWQAFNFTAPQGIIRGAIPNFISALASGSPGAISTAFFRTPAPNMMGVIATIIVFFIVIYAETMRVEVPLAYSRYGGLRGRYPIKFLYASVIPVILSLVLFTNFRIIGRILGGPVQGFVSTYMVSPQGLGAVTADPLRAVVYMLILMGSCMAFAWLWVQMTNMGPRDVAQQLKRSGMSIPGFRRDTRIMEKRLARYITPVTLLGGAFVGALAAGANFLGALSSGTGILLAVSIIYRLYQEIARGRVSEMFPAARRLLGE
ncbi:hypothetical protein AKJ44_02885, partial [candidate division MSBL1 archaeon SCGC-AAA261F17]